MSKTDPRPDSFLFPPGAPSFTLTAVYDGLTVTAIQGGSVTRGGIALAVNDVLHTGDLLASGSPAATVALVVQRAAQEFSGAYADLTGTPAGGGGASPLIADNYVPIVSVNLDAVGGGTPSSPDVNSLIAQAPGYRFTALAAGSITALRAFVRLPATSSATSGSVTFRLQVNGTAIDVTGGGTVYRSKYYTLIEAFPATPISYAANADVYFCALVVSPTGLMLEIPTQNVTDTYNSRGMAGGKPTAQITGVTASAPLTFTTVTPAASFDTYPSMELGTKTLVTAKLAYEGLPLMPAGPTKGWSVVDSQPPRIVSRHNGQAYSLALQPDTPVTGYVSPGTPISLTTGATLGNNEMSIIPYGTGTILAVRYQGAVYQIGVLTLLSPQP
jgi:hypothetical protein